MKRAPAIIAAAAAVVLGVGGWQSAAGVEPAVRQQQFDGEIRPFLAKYCIDCHSGDTPDGELNLQSMAKADEISTKQRKLWQKVQAKLFGRVMPPKDADQPRDEERAQIVAWLKQTIDDYDCGGPTDPGRVTTRRLTRYEYKNTIRDLIGIEVTLADDFPMDDVGYGFDNIGDVLTLSPLLFEKYLAAAEEIAHKAIITDPLKAASNRKLDVARMSGNGANNSGEGWRMFTSAGELRGKLEVPADGEYIIRTRAYGDQAGDELPKLIVTIDGQTHSFDVKAERESPADYDVKLRLGTGEKEVKPAFNNDFYQPDNPNPRQRDRNLAVRSVELVGPLGDDPAAYPEPHRRILFAKPGKDPQGKELSEDEAARQILKRFATRAFRRPATDAEVARLARVAEAGRKRSGNFASGIQLAVQAVLASPHFLFKVEGEPLQGDADGIYDLNDYELATRLSYFLWCTMPDDELFAVAERGELRAELEPQIRRMLADPKAQTLVDNFAVQWLQLRRLANIEPDRRRFGGFSDRLRADMLQETKLFVGAIIREDRSVLELIDADYTFLNERLAKHYGIDGVRGDEFQRVGIDGTDRGGVLTQAAVLTLTSNPTRTSPVKRGKWIMENILGTPPPDPPANVPELNNSREARENASLRERLEEHRRNPDCASCHQQMDAIGLAFENFDAVGAFRKQDGKFDIDASGVLPSGKEFAGAGELKQLLLAEAKHDFLHCLAEKTLTYALGRGVEYYDRCTLDGITLALKKDDYKFSRLVIEIARSDAFQRRRGK